MPKEKIFFKFLAFLLLSLAVFLLDKKGWLDFLKRPVEKATNPLKLLVFREKSAWGEVSTSRVQELEREVAELKVNNQNLKEENQACRRLLQAPLPPSFSFLPAKVLALGEDNFLIDKGSDQGLKAGQVVVLENIFLGQVSQVNPQNAWVKTVFNLEIKGRTFSTRAPGLVKEKAGRLFLSEVLQQEALEKEDLVVVFGEENIPRDLILGKIKEVKKEAPEIYQEAELELMVDYDKLEVVFVIL